MFKTVQVLLKTNVRSFSTEMGMAGRSVSTFDKQVDRAGKTGDASSQKLAKGWKVAAVALTAVVGTMGMFVREAIGFEREMLNVATISADVRDNFARAGEQVLTLSRQLPQDAQTLAKGLYDIASSGFQGAEGLTVLNASATAASAGLSDTATAARAITAVLNAYGKGADEAEDVSDILFQTVNLGVVTFGELAATVGDFVGTAAAAKVPIEDASAAIAAMTLSGISATESGTSLNRLLQSLIQPSEELQVALRDLGYESGSQALATDGLAVVMEKLRISTGGNIDALLKYFPEIRAARGALALMANEGKNFAVTMDGIANAEGRAGSTQKALNIQMKGLGAQIQILTNRGKAWMIQVGTAIIPGITNFLKKAQEMGQKVVPFLAKGWGLIVDLFKSVGPALSSVVRLFGEVAAIVGPVVAGFAAIAGVGVVGALKLLANALKGVADFLREHQTLVTVLAVLIGTKLVTALASAILHFALMRTEGIATFLVGLAQPILNVASAFSTAAAAGGKLAGIKAGLGSLLGAINPIGLAVAAFAAVIVLELQRSQKAANEFIDDIRARYPDTAARLNALRRQEEELSRPRPLFSQWLDEVHAKRKVARKEIELIERAERLEAAALRDVAQATGITTHAIANLADEMGINLASATDAEIQKLKQAAAALHETSPAALATAEALAKMADPAADAADKLTALKDALDQFIGVHLNALEAASKYEEAIDNLIESVKEHGTTLDITGEAGRRNQDVIIGLIRLAQDHVLALREEGKSELEAKAAAEQHVSEIKTLMATLGFGGDAVRLFGSLLDELPRAIGIPISANTSQATGAIVDLQTRIDRLMQQGVIEPTLRPRGPRLFGGIDLFAQRGLVAHFAKSPTVLFGERDTGGEAFIPLGSSNRMRSTNILAEVARMFGYGLLPMQQGGVVSRHGSSGRGSSIVIENLHVTSVRPEDVAPAIGRELSWLDFKAVS